MAFGRLDPDKWQIGARTENVLTLNVKLRRPNRSGNTTLINVIAGISIWAVNMLIHDVVPRITCGTMDAVVSDMETRVHSLPQAAWSMSLIKQYRPTGIVKLTAAGGIILA